MLAEGERDAGEIAVPPAIQALLAARLDHLTPEERRVIERASVEGELFHWTGWSRWLRPRHAKRWHRS